MRVAKPENGRTLNISVVRMLMRENVCNLFRS